jgi:hypothetical protein
VLLFLHSSWGFLLPSLLAKLSAAEVLHHSAARRKGGNKGLARTLYLFAHGFMRPPNETSRQPILRAFSAFVMIMSAAGGRRDVSIAKEQPLCVIASNDR